MWQSYGTSIGHRFNAALRDSWDVVNHLDRQQWLMLLAVVTVVGFLCMRGFGSRSSY